jgi:aspartate racemase
LLEHGGQLWNMYGPTETTIWSAVTRVESTTGPVPIGPPISNTQFYIVDNELEPVPIGVPGELLIGGDGLSRGYLNRPDLTAERFFTTRCSGLDTRVYKTGDLARFRADGRIEFLGRLDFQVKVRGYRIELEEVEHALARHESVKDVAVVTWRDEDSDTRLVAYYIPTAGNRPRAGDLRRHLRDMLPEYMCPSFFVELETFPFTPNGKIDRKAFPKPDVSIPRSGARHVAPQRHVETQLVSIWQHVLKRQPIGLDDNFFELGGHSLLAARLFARIEQTLGVTLPLATLFHAPTIRTLADKVEEHTGGSPWDSLVPIHTQGSKPPLFVVHGAEGNVLLYRGLAENLGNDHPVYGLQAQGLDGGALLESRVETIAAKYREEIQSVQPAGPYYLGGYCLGGTIAFEIAQQLRRAGESVALLAMFESYNVRSRPEASLPLRVIHKAENLYFQGRNVLLSGGSVAFVAEKAGIEFTRLKIRCAMMWSTLVERFRPGRGVRYQHLRILAANHEAQAAYQPVPYDGRITLFKPIVHYRDFNDPYFGWNGLAMDGVRVVDMPNYPRGSLNEPFVRVLARRLQTEMETACQGSAGRAAAAPRCADTPRTASTASWATLTNRSISVSVTTSGGAKKRISPGAG